MKDAGVCKGCRYYNKYISYCTYSEQNGHSRLLIEKRNGGYKKDSCICKEKGNRRRIVKPIIVPKEV